MNLNSQYYFCVIRLAFPHRFSRCLLQLSLLPLLKPSEMIFYLAQCRQISIPFPCAKSLFLFP